MIIERNSGILVHYAGTAKPTVGAGAVREYKLARLPELVVEGLAYRGFSVKGLRTPQEATITALLGERLASVIGQWPAADQARAIHNLIAFMELSRPSLYGANRGIQETLNMHVDAFPRVKIGFDARNSFNPKREPQATVELGVDMEFRSLTGGSCWGRIEVVGGMVRMRQNSPYDTKLPAKDLEAILRFQGE